jgi:hypothetical protein
MFNNIDIEIVILNASGSEAAAKAQRQIPSLCTSTSRCLELEPPLLDLEINQPTLSYINTNNSYPTINRSNNCTLNSPGD